MKKSFWGYHAKEVDEAIDALTKQNTSLIQRNDHLEDELKNMHVQLEEMKANVAHSMTQAQFDEYKELKAAYAALQNRMQDEVTDSDTVKELQSQLDAAQKAAKEAELRNEEEREALQSQLDAAQKAAEEAGLRNEEERKALQSQLDAAQKAAKEAGLRNEEERKALQSQLDAAQKAAKEAGLRNEEEREALQSQLASAQESAYASRQEASALKEEVNALRLQAAEIPDDRELRETRQRYQEALDDLQTARAGQRQAQEETQAVRAQQQELQAEFRTAQEELRGAKEEIAAKEEELVRKDALLADKDEALHQKDDALSEKDAELARLNEQLSQPAFKRQCDMGVSEINEMMKRVGDAIYETKANTYQNMMGAVDDFTHQWEESNGQLEAILKEFDAEKDKTRQELLDAVQLILHQFDQMAQKSETMHANLRNLTARRSELREKLELTVEQLRSEPVEKTEGLRRGESPEQPEEQPEAVEQTRESLYGSPSDHHESVSVQSRDADLYDGKNYHSGIGKRIWHK